MGNNSSKNREQLNTTPTGLYEHCEWDPKVVRRLILERKLAPISVGKDETAEEGLEECPICFLVCYILPFYYVVAWFRSTNVRTSITLEDWIVLDVARKVLVLVSLYQIILHYVLLHIKFLSYYISFHSFLIYVSSYYSYSFAFHFIAIQFQCRFMNENERKGKVNREYLALIYPFIYTPPPPRLSLITSLTSLLSSQNFIHYRMLSASEAT